MHTIAYTTLLAAADYRTTRIITSDLSSFTLLEESLSVSSRLLLSSHLLLSSQILLPSYLSVSSHLNKWSATLARCPDPAIETTWMSTKEHGYKVEGKSLVGGMERRGPPTRNKTHLAT